ncbi:MAG: hypothetical protein ACOX6K_00200 [Sphaerochaetaceae bacterium]|jgi:hypothetical protein
MDGFGYHCTSGMIPNCRIQEEERLLSYHDTTRKSSDTKESGETEVVLFKYKPRLIPAKEKAWIIDGSRKVEVRVNKRQIVFWSRKYQMRTRIDRSESILIEINVIGTSADEKPWEGPRGSGTATCCSNSTGR